MSILGRRVVRLSSSCTPSSPSSLSDVSFSTGGCSSSNASSVGVVVVLGVDVSKTWMEMIFHEHLIIQEMRSPRSIEIWKMGAVNYLEALKLQEKLASDRKLHKIKDTLLSLQHPPTYTLGKRRTVHNVLVSEAELKAMGAELHYTERGGDVTFHGPRQAILYPIVSLRDIGIGARKYVENLESTMIELASLYGVKARAGERGETGVWVGRRKIGAIGVRISSGITSHGLAFNIDPDLNYFKHIVPCGIPDKEVTSLQKEAGVVIPSDEVIHEQLISCFVKIFGCTDITWRDKSSLYSDDRE